MKIRYIFSDFKPAKKCGAEVAAAVGIASGLGSIIDNAVSSEQQAQNVSNQLAAQHYENALNRDFNSQQAEFARNFQERMQGEQNQFVSGLQDKQQQFNLQSMVQQAYYNSPVYQREQLQKAGINPAVYFGNKSSFSGSSAVAGGSPSVPSVGSPSSASANMGLSPVSFQPQHLQIGVLTSQMANNIKTMAEARKIEKETGWIDESTRANIRALNAQSDLNDVMKAGQDIMNQLSRAKVPYAYKQAAADLYKACSEIELNKANKITSESQAKVNAALEKLHNAQTNLSAKELEKLGIEVQMYPQYLKSVINKNAAEAEQSHALAQTENVLREFKKDIASLDVELKANEKQLEYDTFQYKVDKIIKESKLAENKAALTEIELHDKRSYNALWRVIRGRGQSDDYKDVLRLFNDLDYMEYYNK